MTDAVLDDPGFIARREKFWTAVLTDPGYGTHRAAIAERDDSLIGIAMAGPVIEPAVDWSVQLYVLYTYSARPRRWSSAARGCHRIDGNRRAVGRRPQPASTSVLPQARLPPGWHIQG